MGAIIKTPITLDADFGDKLTLTIELTITGEDLHQDRAATLKAAKKKAKEMIEEQLLYIRTRSSL